MRVSAIFNAKISICVVVCLGFSLSALAQNTPKSLTQTEPIEKTSPESAGTIVQPQVWFVSPKNGATVKEKFKVKFGIKGMKVAKAGPLVAGTGHYHIIVDGGPAANGTVIPKDDTHIHYGNAQTEAELTLPKGEHILTLQFADGSHASYGDKLSQTIKVKVQ